MDAIPEHTRSFSEIVSRIYAVVKWEDMGNALLQLVAKFFDVDKGAILRFGDDADAFETAASVWVDDQEIKEQVLSWGSKLPGLSTESNPVGQDVYLLRRHPSKPTHNVSKLLQRLTHSQKESSLVGVIGKHQQKNCLIWLHRNADKPNFRPYDLELLKMVLLHMRQALDFRQQIDNLKKHLSGKGYVA
jgi:GAF domain-containing protein